MKGMSWTETKTNEWVLKIVHEKRCLLVTIDNRRGKIFLNPMQHDRFLRSTISKERGRRPR